MYVIVNLDNENLKSLTRKINIEYTYSHKVIKHFEKMGLAKSELKGVKKNLSLTEKGSELKGVTEKLLHNLRDLKRVERKQ